MAIITEAQVRERLRGAPLTRFQLEAGERLTPAAREYLRDLGIPIEEAPRPQRATRYPGYVKPAEFLLPDGTRTAVKPDHYTQLDAVRLVPKTHPRIALRGALDLFQAHLIQAQVLAHAAGLDQLTAHLEEVHQFGRALMAHEVEGTDPPPAALFGLTEDELHAESHSRWVEVSYRDGALAAALNTARAAARQVELAAVAAFVGRDGKAGRPALLHALNRLSGAVYVLVLRYEQGLYPPRIT